MIDYIRRHARIDYIKHFLLKYVISYRNPRRYWNARWKLDVETERKTTELDKKLFSKIKKLMQNNKCENILEIGCGQAQLRDLPNYTGLDFSFDVLKGNRLKKFIYADMTEQIPVPDKTFDVTLSKFVLLHIPFDKIEQAIKEISRVTKKLVILKEPWGTRSKHSQPHCFSHNLPKLFKKYFDGDVIFLNNK